MVPPDQHAHVPMREDAPAIDLADIGPVIEAERASDA